jgi:hypothetical protein
MNGAAVHSGLGCDGNAEVTARVRAVNDSVISMDFDRRIGVGNGRMLATPPSFDRPNGPLRPSHNRTTSPTPAKSLETLRGLQVRVACVLRLVENLG